MKYIKRFFNAITGLFKKAPLAKPVEQEPVETKPIETKPTPEVPTSGDGDDRVTGIDIYHGDKITSWAELKKKEDFVIIKATEGDWRNDPQFEVFRYAAANAGIPCGFYHFYRSNKDSIKQAQDFIRMVGKLNPGELCIVCDWETEDDSGDGPDIDEVQKFLDIVEKHFGVVPWIYGGSSFLKSKNLPESFARYPLWLAHYTDAESPRVPGPWKNYTVWQYTDKAIVNGVKNPCDRNRFNGTRSDLEKFRKESL